MDICEESLSTIDRYISNHPLLPIEQHRPAFNKYLRVLKRFTTVDRNSQLLEIGIGTGGFPVLCALEGIRCKGLEISPQLVAYARQYGHRYGVEPEIELGNVESDDLGEALYDAIIVSFVFEHVAHWREGLANVYRALKPGAAMYFESTNKFCPTSGEHPIPFYSWLPDRWRYRLRRHGFRTRYHEARD